MFRRFLSDRRGNYMLLTAVAIVPIMGGLAVAVDYTEMSRQRQLTLNALDAAGVATARRLIEGGSTDAQLVAYADQFFQANLGSVDPKNAKLHVTLPTGTGGGGKIKLSADLTYQPYFLPVLAALMGSDANSATQVDFNAQTEVQMKNTLEIALVLDNSGSMVENGAGSGKQRMTLVKEAASQLVDTLAQQASQMKQVAKPMQFAVVPFAASVNIGAQNAGASWMDQDGISPIHHEIFNWGAFAGENKKVQMSGGAYYKKGSDWGAEEGEKVTRFTLYDEMQVKTGQTWIDTSGYVCKRWSNGVCTKQKWVSSGHWEPTYAQFASWQGCVEARPYPYNTNDAAPTSGTPATLYVPMFAPDETDRTDGYWRSANGNWWPDSTSSSNDRTRQEYTPKYFEAAPQGTPVPGWGQGPNGSCTTKPITPLTDVTNSAGKKKILDAIDVMSPNGATNVPEGLAWGWRTVSGGVPFTEGRPDSEKGNDKVVIVLTDGENTYYTPESLGYNDLGGNKSIYSAYGYAGQNQPGGSSARIFMGTSVGKSDYTNANYSAAMDQQLAATCTNAKTNGLLVMTVAVDLSTTNPQQKKQIAGLKACASDSRFRKDASDPSKPAKLFWNTTGGNLSQTFKEIADELSNLRITS